MKTCGNCAHSHADQDGHGSPTGQVSCKLADWFCKRIERAFPAPPCIWIAPMIIAASKDASKCPNWTRKP